VLAARETYFARVIIATLARCRLKTANVDRNFAAATAPIKFQTSLQI
jgi:hypothetical protein